MKKGVILLCLFACILQAQASFQKSKIFVGVAGVLGEAATRNGLETTSKIFDF